MNNNLPNENQHINSDNNKQDEVDLIKLFFLMLSNWYWFVLAVLVALAFAWLYNSHTLPTWRVSATVLIDEDKGSRASIGSDQLLEGFGLRSGMKNLDNQLLILTSWALIEKTLDELPFGTEYYTRGRINKIAFYPESPIKVFADSSYLIPTDVEFRVRLIDDNSYSILANTKGPDEVEIQAAFGEFVEINGSKIRIEKINSGVSVKGTPATIYFMIHSHDKLVESFRSRLKAVTASKEGTIIKLSLDGTNRKMDIDFLNKLIEVFVNNNLERKNLEAVRTVDFIEGQLSGISDSLSITEDRLQKFRSANKVMDMSAQGQQIINQAMTLENEKAKLVIESNYYEYLADYLSKDISGEQPVSPATMGISDPGLTNLVVELANLQSEYFSNNMTDRNPMRAQIAQKLRNTRDALNETLKGVRHANDLSMRENARQIRSINASAVTLPKTERELLGFQREFKLNDVLYSFLIEKMAEAQIQKASNTPDNEIVDKARPDGVPVSPKTKVIYIFALLAGIGLPFIILLLVNAMNVVIKNEDDLRNITDLPIAGYIPHSILNGKTLVLKDTSTIIAEAFRSLRSRIQFFTKEIKSPVILVTSSMPGEGKSFTAINLASIYSLTGKRTLLIDFDLRIPTLYKQFEISNFKGVSTWLIGKDQLSDVINKTQYENLDFISAGTIPPNPAELIASDKTSNLFSELRELYDFIVVDSAPIGTISDSLSLARFADASIILVRHGKTIAPFLANTIEGAKSNGISSLCIVMNDISEDKSKYGYRYTSGYRYGHKYYGREPKAKKEKLK
jgi:tyrosine-protein kinase Etk/Wzc